jgi:hypothetical protein
MREALLGFVRAPARRKLLGIFTVAGFALPALAYFAFVNRYAVNVVVFDQWSDVALVEKAFSGHLSLSDLWAQHNENRILFPNLIVLVLAYATHLNIRTEEYISAVLLAGTVFLVIWAHRRRSPATPLIWYSPVAILMFSWAQFENTLWGFQIAWYVVMICLAGTLAVLDREQVTGPSLAIGAALAVIGSMSSLQGLLIWPAAAVLLLYRRRSAKVLATWVVAAAATVSLYYYHFNTSQLGYSPINPFLHPAFEIKLFFFSLGNVAGKPIGVPLVFYPQHNHPVLGAANPWIIAFGVVIFITGVIAVARTGFRDAKNKPAALGVSLILFALGFAGLTAIGRGLYGYAGVSASRYTTYTMLALVGSYLVVIGNKSTDQIQTPTRPSSSVVHSVGTTTLSALRRTLAVVGVTALPIVVAACVLIQAFSGYYNGLSGGRHDHAIELGATKVFRNYRAERDQLIFYIPTTYLPETFQLIRVAQLDNLSLFTSR